MDDALSDTDPGGAGAAPPTGDDDVRKAALRARLFPEASAPRVGRYTVLRILGEGGMGTVYACFDDKLDRRVAVKLIKGVASEDARLRMLREAQAMAKLSHPNVVPVFEVGEHDGQLFVAMEFIRGMSLQAWQNETSRTWREVLGHYLQAGRGLAAAHAEGLVHRDFKPHNAMVGEDDRVRVLDFGLATRSAGELERTAPDEASRKALDVQITETGAVMGTPAYMAPEQFAGRVTDHRSDQFSFCVALWEGLYGERPFAGDTISAILEHIERGELTPPGPTDTPSDVERALRRGLARVPSDRWPDLATLLDELARLDVDPARVRRQRRLVLGVVAAVPALGAAWLGGRAWVDGARTRECEDEARTRLDRAWNDALREDVRTALLDTGVDFADTTVARVLPALDDHANAWQRAATRACVATRVTGTWSGPQLDRAQWCLEERVVELGSLVEALAKVDRQGINSAVVAAANLAPVEPCSDRALLERLPPPPAASERDAAQTLRGLLSRAGALAETGKYDAGRDAANEALESAMAFEGTGPRGRARALLGLLQSSGGEFEDAAETLEDAYFEAVQAHDFVTAVETATELTYVHGERLADRETAKHWARLSEAAITELGLPQDHPLVAKRLNELAAAHRSAGEYAEALALDERALAIQIDAMGETSPIVAATTSNIAASMMYMGEAAEAKAMQKQALEIREAAYGKDHPEVGNATQMLATFHFALGEYEEAKPIYLRALEVLESALGPDHPDVASVLNNLGNVHDATARYTEAKAFHERALAIREKAGPEHPEVAESLNNLGIVLVNLGEHERAQAAYERALAIRVKVFGAEHPGVWSVHQNLGNLHYQRGRHDDAIPAYQHALDIARKVFGAEHPNVATSLFGLGQAYEGAGRLEEAEPLIEESLTLRKSIFGAEHPGVATSLNALGSVHLGRGEYVEAGARFDEALEVWETTLGPEHPDLAWGLENLAKVRQRSGRSEEAEPLLSRALELREKALGSDHELVGQSLASLGDFHAAAGDTAAARRDYGRALEILEAADADLERRVQLKAWLKAGIEGR